uniref:Uncharacterized protein n=1 Tax=Glossina pallidipes TaxID=7398 RepID=A0A1A9ZLP4_GLOPL
MFCMQQDYVSFFCPSNENNGKHGLQDHLVGDALGLFSVHPCEALKDYYQRPYTFYINSSLSDEKLTQFRYVRLPLCPSIVDALNRRKILKPDMHFLHGIFAVAKVTQSLALATLQIFLIFLLFGEITQMLLVLPTSKSPVAGLSLF